MRSFPGHLVSCWAAVGAQSSAGAFWKCCQASLLPGSCIIPYNFIPLFAIFLPSLYFNLFSRSRLFLLSIHYSFAGCQF